MHSPKASVSWEHIFRLGNSKDVKDEVCIKDALNQNI